MKFLKKFKKRLLAGLASWAAAVLIRLIRKTVRIEVKGREHLDEALALRRGVILAFWHGGMLVPMMRHVGMDVGVLVGEHEDGEIVARVLSSFGFPLVRGSATRGGRHAMTGMTERLRANKIMAITPDGPSGPYHECKAGLAVLASRTGTPILPMVSASSHSIILKSWDRFRFVLPFSRCILRYGEPMLPDGGDRAGDTRSLAVRVEETLERLERETMAEAGINPSGAPVFSGKQSGNPVFLERIFHAAAIIYKYIIIMRNWAYDEGIFRERGISVPVISVGNISLGGTGKTPMTLMLADYFKREGLIPAVVSRGYGRKSKGMRIVTDGHVKASDWRETGDEAMFMANNLSGVPVLVCKNRYKAAAAAVRTFGCNVILLDDGFQHRKLKRNLDIVLVNAGKSAGDDALFPEGSLREPAGGLGRADLLVVTKESEGMCPGHEEFQAYSNAPVFRAGYVPKALRRCDEGSRIPPDEWQGISAVAFAGLADPDSFFGTLAAGGIRLLRTEYYPDHHAYTHRDWKTLSSMFERTGADMLITTEKDAVRIDKSYLTGFPLYVLESEWSIAGDADLFFRIVRSAVPIAP